MIAALILDVMPAGRRPVATLRTTRLRHIRIAYHRLVAGRSLRWVMARFHCCRRSVQLWTRAALTYDDEEAVTLRRILAGPDPPN
jgi:hypothetical protein